MHVLSAATPDNGVAICIAQKIAVAVLYGKSVRGEKAQSESNRKTFDQHYRSSCWKSARASEMLSCGLARRKNFSRAFTDI